MSPLRAIAERVVEARGLDRADLDGLDWEGFGRACRDAMARLRPLPGVDGYLQLSSSGEAGAPGLLVPAGPPTTAVQSVAAPLPSPTSISQPREAVVHARPALRGAVTGGEASSAQPGGVATLPGHSGRLLVLAGAPRRRRPLARLLLLPAVLAALGAAAALFGPLAAAGALALSAGPLAAGLVLRLEPAS